MQYRETPPGRIAGRTITVLAAMWFLWCLYAAPWWPSTYLDRYFLSTRHTITGGSDWFDVFYTSYFSFGYLLATVAVLAAPFLVGRASRWHWVTLLTLLAVIWQIVAVKGATLINTTYAPLTGPIVAGIGITIGWVICRSAAAPGQRLP